MFISDQPPAIVEPDKSINPKIRLFFSDDADQLCRHNGANLPGNQTVLACSGLTKDGDCLIIIDKRVSEDYVKEVIAHPQGCKGMDKSI